MSTFSDEILECLFRKKKELHVAVACVRRLLGTPDKFSDLSPHSSDCVFGRADLFMAEPVIPRCRCQAIRTLEADEMSFWLSTREEFCCRDAWSLVVVVTHGGAPRLSRGCASWTEVSAQEPGPARGWPVLIKKINMKLNSAPAFPI